MSIHFRQLVDFDVDDTGERMCGIEPVTVDELYDYHLAREDRQQELAPACSPSRSRREPQPRPVTGPGTRSSWSLAGTGAAPRRRPVNVS